MIKTTRRFNNLQKLFSVFLLTGSGLYAQCPANITVGNDGGECGAVVEYAVEGSGAAQSPNGIVNGSGANGLTGWTATNGAGTTWVAAGDGGFISSYSMGTMSQVVDLTSMALADDYMDTMPAITVSENYKGTSVNVGDIYRLTVELRGEANNVLATYTTGNLTGTANWQTVTHVFTGYPAGVRKVFFQHSGDDAEGWAGNFGTAITNASLTVAIPTSVVVQTAGIESGEIFPVGTTTNSFTITDEDDVTTTCSFTVTVTDDDAPVAVPKETIIAELDANGVATITAADVDDESTDNCVFTMAVNVTSFTCEDLGDNAVVLSVSDGTNTTTANATVTVVDNIAPVAIAQALTVEITEGGVVTITPEDVDNGSTDNCTISLYELSKTTFDCSDIGANTVTLTVTDASGNESTTTAVITIEDTTAPEVITQNITIQLPLVTMVSINALDINDGSTDNCGISSYTLDNQIFTCENIGENTVTLTITDNYGNVSSATAIVTVEDPENYCQFAGLDENLAQAIQLYPNPTTGQVNIDAAGFSIDKVEFYDINARLVKSFETKNATGVFTADISNLDSGMYLIRMYSGTNTVIKKIVKQ
jgi:hypothetical protein